MLGVYLAPIPFKLQHRSPSHRHADRKTRGRVATREGVEVVSRNRTKRRKFRRIDTLSKTIGNITREESCAGYSSYFCPFNGGCGSEFRYREKRHEREKEENRCNIGLRRDRNQNCTPPSTRGIMKLT